MCFDIDVTKLNNQELRDTLARISRLLEQPGVLRNLPDNGHQLRQTQSNLQKEIEFRENLEKTRLQMQKLSIRCNSEANIATTHSAKICTLSRKPVQERFKPHLSLRTMPSGKAESMKDLHSGTKLLDLVTSMSLQKEQEERVKAAQVQAKQHRLVTAKEGESDDEYDSDDESEYNLSDYYSDNEDDSDDEGAKVANDKPGTSQVKNEEPVEELKKPVKEHEEPVEELEGAVKELEGPVEELEGPVEELREPMKELKELVEELAESVLAEPEEKGEPEEKLRELDVD